VPTGGITPEKLPEYLKLPPVVACGGSWLAPRELLSAGRFDEIRELVERAVGVLTSVPKRH
jgi:2-dehydro-3-deoxyphosphogluconate aldolase/(4S)-4-hydroxy-2-oxoglutarate aldolase